MSSNGRFPEGCSRARPYSRTASPGEAGPDRNGEVGMPSRGGSYTLTFSPFLYFVEEAGSGMVSASSASRSASIAFSSAMSMMHAMERQTSGAR